MGHVVRKTTWGDIDLDTTTGRVFFQQKWLYNWFHIAPATAWTLAEKRAFHGTLDQQIWSVWSNRVRIQVVGSAWARGFRRGLPINFDIRWVLSAAHWTINARKLVAGGSYRSNVSYASRIINLDSEDVKAHAVANDAGSSNPAFLTGPHEFGHTVDTDVNPDEYNDGSADLGDAGSLMNIGKKVRARHISAIIAELNVMMPGTTFRP